MKDEQPGSVEDQTHVIFNNLKVGQQSRYVLFVGDNYSDIANNKFNYLKDTLVVTIVGRDNKGYKAMEALTPGSASLHGDNHVAYADSTFFYYLNAASQQLSVNPIVERNHSRLFFLYPPENESLPLPPFVSPELVVTGWKILLPSGVSLAKGYVAKAAIFGKNYPRLNAVVDNRKLVSDGVGNLHLYSGDEGLVRSCQYNRFNGKGFGWDLLP